jgi:hypothetical protein
MEKGGIKITIMFIPTEDEGINPYSSRDGGGGP